MEHLPREIVHSHTVPAFPYIHMGRDTELLHRLFPLETRRFSLRKPLDNRSGFRHCRKLRLFSLCMHFRVSVGASCKDPSIPRSRQGNPHQGRSRRDIPLEGVVLVPRAIHRHLGRWAGLSNPRLCNTRPLSNLRQWGNHFPR